MAQSLRLDPAGRGSTAAPLLSHRTGAYQRIEFGASPTATAPLALTASGYPATLYGAAGSGIVIGDPFTHRRTAFQSSDESFSNPTATVPLALESYTVE